MQQNISEDLNMLVNAAYAGRVTAESSLCDINVELVTQTVGKTSN